MTAGRSRSHFRQLANVVRNNLENQQDWTQLQTHGDDYEPDNEQDDGGGSGSGTGTGGKRILLSGLPPRRVYIHPDEQIELMRAERALGNGRRIAQPPEHEWVLPMHLAETPTISQFAAIFDSIDPLPPAAVEAEAASPDEGQEEETAAQWKKWRNAKRSKRLLLAIVQDDSTVVYYVMQDGIVKPRQN
ncbi:tRNA-intron endonuclease [Grosmannia clavigera kw1407]|uniref:tRNA-intron endonuclease n=1 Tax=Grosmannia clavigera (strain kw1407 / UAMH 11150) TaxID=655863 RepID=F0XQJ9_GROCL|nr:tRNA-intron endonuclease [Grosmannia clavigera kw1407]EFX00448.1 tRNA-intron endonuclease [Grosmannia clavigera kw1407]